MSVKMAARSRGDSSGALIDPPLQPAESEQACNFTPPPAGLSRWMLNDAAVGPARARKSLRIVRHHKRRLGVRRRKIAY